MKARPLDPEVNLLKLAWPLFSNRELMMRPIVRSAGLPVLIGIIKEGTAGGRTWYALDYDHLAQFSVEVTNAINRPATTDGGVGG